MWVPGQRAGTVRWYKKIGLGMDVALPFVLKSMLENKLRGFGEFFLVHFD